VSGSLPSDDKSTEANMSGASGQALAGAGSIAGSASGPRPVSLPPQEIVEEVLGNAAADATVAIVHTGVSSNVRFAANKLTTSGTVSSTSLTVVSFRNGAYGTARGEVTSLEQAIPILRRSEEIASKSKPAPDAFDLVTAEEAAPLRDSFSVEFIPPYGVEFFDRISPPVREAFSASGRAGQLLFGYIEHESGAVYLGTSTGVRAGYVESRSHLGMTAKPEDFSRSVWTGQTGRTLDDIDPVRAQQRCQALLALARERRHLDPGRYRCVLSASCVSDMLLWMYWLMSLRDADEGKSAFSDRPKGGNKLGQQLYPEFVSLRSDPSDDKAFCLPFVLTSVSHSLESVFDNGFPLSRISWIESGVQENLVSTRRYASEKGLSPTPMVANLLLDCSAGASSSAPSSPGQVTGDELPQESSGAEGSAQEGSAVGAGADRSASPDDDLTVALGSAAPLVAGVDRGLYVNCLWYIRLVDPQTALLTGLTRDGVYLIEDGRIVAEVNNFRFNQSPVEMLARCKAGGLPELATPREFDDVGCWVQAPPIVVDEFNMSTISEAV
jgi:predicted Zn-dependent protease